jgi:ATP-binding cassette subfamily B protein
MTLLPTGVLACFGDRTMSAFLQKSIITEKQIDAYGGAGVKYGKYHFMGTRGDRMRIPIKQYSQLLSRYLRSQKSAVLLLGVLLMSGITLQLVNPQVIRYFIDTAQSGGELRYLWYAGGLFIAAALIAQLLRVLAGYIGQSIGWTATNQMRGDLAAHCLSLDLSYHKEQTPGAIIERVDGDVNVLANFFSNLVILLVSNMLLILGILIMLYREGWQIGLGMTFFVLFALWAIQYVRRYAAPHWARMRMMSAEYYGFLGEHLEGTEDTRASGATGYVMHRFYDIIRRWLPIRLRAFFGWALMWITSIFVFALGTAAAFAVCAYLWSQGLMTLGTVYMVFAYTELMGGPIEQIRTQLEDLQKADISIKRVRELFDRKPAITDGPGVEYPNGPLAVAFDDVRFGYEADVVTLDGITFKLEPGRVLGLLGRTGSGKSTLARLMLRFYDPQEGAVCIGGYDAREASIQDLRRRVGLVTQNIEIFQGTIRDNLTFFDSRVADARVLEVLDELGLTEWLAGQPAGLDSELDSGGGGLSAGEAQLLAFARVFLRNPGLIILDEASSRLDPATENRMERAITKLLGGRTCIIIAHRLRTIERADDILILEEGHVLEYGERLALAADPNSRFHQLMKAGMEEVLA